MHKLMDTFHNELNRTQIEFNLELMRDLGLTAAPNADDDSKAESLMAKDFSFVRQSHSGEKLAVARYIPHDRLFPHGYARGLEGVKRFIEDEPLHYVYLASGVNSRMEVIGEYFQPQLLERLEGDLFGAAPHEAMVHPEVTADHPFNQLDAETFYDILKEHHTAAMVGVPRGDYRQKNSGSDVYLEAFRQYGKAVYMLVNKLDAVLIFDRPTGMLLGVASWSKHSGGCDWINVLLVEAND